MAAPFYLFVNFNPVCRGQFVVVGTNETPPKLQLLHLLTHPLPHPLFLDSKSWTLVSDFEFVICHMTLGFVRWHMIQDNCSQGHSRWTPSLNRCCVLWHQVVQPWPFIWPVSFAHGHLLYSILAHLGSLCQHTLNARWTEFPTVTRLTASSL